jgi:AcrR family transcriptional regulator
VRQETKVGDPYGALLDAGTELARVGGPDAVVLGDAILRAGVAPDAAYRHFADQRALLLAVCSVAQSTLAVAIETELAKVGHGSAANETLPPERQGGGPADAARARLRAVGAGYLNFAQTEPGLFRTAFSVPDDLRNVNLPARAGNSGMTPLQLLSTTLDELVETSVLPKDRRPGWELLAWSAVHGLAVLIIDGPLRGLYRTQTQSFGQRLLDIVEKGL